MTNTTHAIAVIDRSGSMSSIRTDAEGGFNAFIEDQKKETSDNLLVTLFTFDNTVEKEYSDLDVAAVPEFSLVPRGSTALLDAISFALAEAEKFPADDKVILLIVTDGQENSSIESTYDSVKERMKKFEDNTNNTVIFHAANLDVAKESHSLGIHRGISSEYVASSAGVRSAYNTLSSQVSSIRGN